MTLPRVANERRVGEFGILFVSLLALMVLPELLPAARGFRWHLPLFFSVVMLSALSTVSRHRRDFYVASTLLVLGLVPQWIGAFQTANVATAARIPLALFLIYVCALILRKVLTAEVVDLEVVLAALCVYLLMALIWGIAYQLVEVFQPGSFTIPDSILDSSADPVEATNGALHYFSYVTITTLGYGDVTPVAPIARSLAIVEALVGQIYLVTLIARLVSMQTLQRGSAHDSDEP